MRQYPASSLPNKKISGQLDNQEKKSSQCPTVVLFSRTSIQKWTICLQFWVQLEIIVTFPHKSCIGPRCAVLCYLSLIAPSLVWTHITSLQLLDEGCGSLLNCQFPYISSKEMALASFSHLTLLPGVSPNFNKPVCSQLQTCKIMNQTIVKYANKETSYIF